MQHVNLFKSFLLLCYTLSLASLSSLNLKSSDLYEKKKFVTTKLTKICKQYPFIERHIQDSKLYSLNSPSAGKKNSITCAHKAPEILLPSLSTQPRKANYTAERCAWKLMDGTYGSLRQKSSELAPDSKQQQNKNGHNRISTSNFLQIPGNNSLEEKKSAKNSEESLSNPNRTDNQPAGQARWIPSCFSFRVVYCLRSWTVHLACKFGE